MTNFCKNYCELSYCTPSQIGPHKQVNGLIMQLLRIMTFDCPITKHCARCIKTKQTK